MDVRALVMADFWSSRPCYGVVCVSLARRKLEEGEESMFRTLLKLAGLESFLSSSRFVDWETWTAALPSSVAGTPYHIYEDKKLSIRALPRLIYTSSKKTMQASRLAPTGGCILSTLITHV